MRLALVVPLFALAASGCAAVFRDHNPRLRVESDPPGADVRVRNQTPGKTPVDTKSSRRGETEVVLTKAGYNEHVGVVKKKMNPGWLVLDIVTCPFTLCIPLVIDAVSGAWMDIEGRYVAKLERAAGGAGVAAGPNASGSIAALPAPVPTTTPAPAGPQMTDSERKASARAAFLEGVALQEKGNNAEALSRFVTAQKLFDAPTHQLRIGQTQAATGRLVEAQETYETLVRRTLPPGSPEPFRDAQEQGKKDIEKLRPRIPVLRVQLQPAPSTLANLAIQINGQTMPNELLGIARPINPGLYRVTATAAGYKPSMVEVELKEGGSKAAELTLVR